MDLTKLHPLKLYGRLSWLEQHDGTVEEIEEVKKELRKRGYTVR